MDKKLILAVAGAGKTYTLVSKLNLEEKNLILAFTNQNIFNIKEEIKKQYGKIPIKTKIMTFHSFVYQFFILPYKPTIFKFFGIENLKVNGISFKDPPPPFNNGIGIYNKNYITQDKIGHYIENNKWFCCLMTKLICVVKNKDINLIEKGITNLNIFFDKIYIDEFQDFRGNDYEFLENLLKKFNRVLAVGDYYQHSVSGKNNTGKPLGTSKKSVSYEEYLKKMTKLKIKIDTESLLSSRRCPEEICGFVKEKLDINISADNKNVGKVTFLKNEEIEDILENIEIKKLVFKEAEKYNFNAVNWGYSKGDTYENICVILSSGFENLDSREFKKPLTSITVNKLYVALTRTKGNLYIIKKSQFDLVKNKYRIKE
ncbi:UvrD-helicase domain-containing protein [uncultured Fusobacterium sp.]|uniref:UvrD-helicase domain-containing protein n=1 Tax=uncultured Fusobacterium sp. TaxID=159267 RepID=UPI000BBADFE8|nr:UvrD-helicase domain-containing protein [uncultured Fusobacterium sp.]BBA49976.1 hypothetical protein FV113G1_03230 [Fusobacterium varium]